MTEENHSGSNLYAGVLRAHRGGNANNTSRQSKSVSRAQCTGDGSRQACNRVYTRCGCHDFSPTTAASSSSTHSGRGDPSTSGMNHQHIQTAGPNSTTMATNASSQVAHPFPNHYDSSQPGCRRTRAEMPSLRRTDFGEHHPDGGWGWVVCGAAFVVHFLSHGMQLASGTLAGFISEKFPLTQQESVWLGSVSYGISILISPVVTAIVSRRSSRLVAIVGALVSVLGCLFMSFSKHKHQMFICWGLVTSLGTGITLSSASVIVGRYFHKRREVAEMLVLCGSGVGMAIMSVTLKQLLTVLGWMRGMQVVAVLMLPLTVAASLYRSAALYHPRRRAIIHIRNLKKSKLAQREFENRQPYIDFSPLRMRALQLLMVSSCMTSAGIHVPFLILPIMLSNEQMDGRSITLLMVYMGVAFAFGSLLVGLMVVRSSLRCMIARQYLTQITSAACGLVTLLFTLAADFNAYSLYVWSYGLLSGGYTYSIKMLTYEQVTVKLAERTWGYMMLVQALPILIGTPLALHMNGVGEPLGRGGFIFAGMTMVLGSLVLFLMPCASKHRSNSEVIHTAHLRARALDRDMMMRGMDVSTNDPSSHRCNDTTGPNEFDKVQAWTQRNAKLHMVTEEKEDEDDLVEVAANQSTSVDNITDFLMHSQSMLKSFSKAHNITIPKVEIDVIMEEEYPTIGNIDDGGHKCGKIKGLKLEATVTQVLCQSGDNYCCDNEQRGEPSLVPREDDTPLLVIQAPSSDRDSEGASESYSDQDSMGPTLDGDSSDNDVASEYSQPEIELCEKMTTV